MNRTESERIHGIDDARLASRLRLVVPDGVSTRSPDRPAMAHDASHHLLNPRAVVTPADAGPVRVRPRPRPGERDRLQACASTNRTCEIGMSRATGHTYRPILELLGEVTRPAGAGR